jgi:hypothetical protein
MDANVSREHNASIFRSEVIYTMEIETLQNTGIHLQDCTVAQSFRPDSKYRRENLKFYMIYLSLFVSNLGGHKGPEFQNFRDIMISVSR